MSTLNEEFSLMRDDIQIERVRGDQNPKLAG